MAERVWNAHTVPLCKWGVCDDDIMSLREIWFDDGIGSIRRARICVSRIFVIY